MIAALAWPMLLATIHISGEPPGSAYCPSDAIGYVRVVKDGIRVAGGAFKVQNGILTAWFPSFSERRAAMTLDLNTFQQHATAGSVRMHRGTFCAFPVAEHPN
jgi:hypothetical protein